MYSEKLANLAEKSNSVSKKETYAVTLHSNPLNHAKLSRPPILRYIKEVRRPLAENTNTTVSDLENSDFKFRQGSLKIPRSKPFTTCNAGQENRNDLSKVDTSRRKTVAIAPPSISTSNPTLMTRPLLLHNKRIRNLLTVTPAAKSENKMSSISTGKPGVPLFDRECSIDAEASSTTVNRADVRNNKNKHSFMKNSISFNSTKLGCGESHLNLKTNDVPALRRRTSCIPLYKSRYQNNGATPALEPQTVQYKKSSSSIKPPKSFLQRINESSTNNHLRSQGIDMNATFTHEHLTNSHNATAKSLIQISEETSDEDTNDSPRSRDIVVGTSVIKTPNKESVRAKLRNRGPPLTPAPPNSPAVNKIKLPKENNVEAPRKPDTKDASTNTTSLFFLNTQFLKTKSCVEQSIFDQKQILEKFQFLQEELLMEYQRAFEPIRHLQRSFSHLEMTDNAPFKITAEINDLNNENAAEVKPAKNNKMYNISLSRSLSDSSIPTVEADKQNDSVSSIGTISSPFNAIFGHGSKTLPFMTPCTRRTFRGMKNNLQDQQFQLLND